MCTPGGEAAAQWHEGVVRDRSPCLGCVWNQIQRASKARKRDLPSSLVAKTHCFYCRGHGFDPWSGNLKKKKKGQKEKHENIEYFCFMKSYLFSENIFIKCGYSFYLIIFSFLLITFWFQGSVKIEKYLAPFALQNIVFLEVGYKF